MSFKWNLWDDMLPGKPAEKLLPHNADFLLKDIDDLLKLMEPGILLLIIKLWRRMSAHEFWPKARAQFDYTAGQRDLKDTIKSISEWLKRNTIRF